MSPVVQMYLDAWNSGDPIRLRALFLPRSVLIGDGVRVVDLNAWVAHQSNLAMQGAHETFAHETGQGAIRLVRYRLRMPDGSVITGTDEFTFFVNKDRRPFITSLIWTSDP